MWVSFAEAATRSVARLDIPFKYGIRWMPVSDPLAVARTSRVIKLDIPVAGGSHRDHDEGNPFTAGYPLGIDEGNPLPLGDPVGIMVEPPLGGGISQGNPLKSG